MRNRLAIGTVERAVVGRCFAACRRAGAKFDMGQQLGMLRQTVYMGLGQKTLKRECNRNQQRHETPRRYGTGPNFQKLRHVAPVNSENPQNRRFLCAICANSARIPSRHAGRFGTPGSQFRVFSLLCDPARQHHLCVGTIRLPGHAENKSPRPLYGFAIAMHLSIIEGRVRTNELHDVAGDDACVRILFCGGTPKSSVCSLFHLNARLTTHPALTPPVRPLTSAVSEELDPLPCGGVAQLVRVTACHAVGRGFEPRRSRQSSENPDLKSFLSFRILL